ncbi:hypothetical protein TeGR_g14176, partial [Tetraparma gracilis]
SPLPPPSPQAFMERLKAYQSELDDLGIRDYQVPTLDHGRPAEADADAGKPPALKRRGSRVSLPDEETTAAFLSDARVPYRILHLLFVITITLVPTLFLNLPIGLMSSIYAERKRKKALKGSKVKIAAYDVMLSEKVIFCIVMVPTLWFVYGVGLTLFTNLDREALTLCFMSFPIFSYIGVTTTESGMVDMKDLRPHYMRLFPTTRKRYKRLPATRVRLVKEMRQLVKKLGPQLGEMYYAEQVDWHKVQSTIKALNSSNNLEALAAGADDKKKA